MPLIYSATLPHLVKGPLGVLGYQRFGVGGGSLERRNRQGVADVAQRYTDVSQHAAALGSKEERLRLLVPDPENFRGATPLAPRESPKTTTATWQSAAAARWRSHFHSDAGSDDSVVDVYE